MKKKALTAVCLLIVLIANAQNFSSDMNKKSCTDNLLIDLKTYSNEFLLKEAAVYIDKKNNMDSALMCYSICRTTICPSSD